MSVSLCLCLVMSRKLSINDVYKCFEEYFSLFVKVNNSFKSIATSSVKDLRPVFNLSEQFRLCSRYVCDFICYVYSYFTCLVHFNPVHNLKARARKMSLTTNWFVEKLCHLNWLVLYWFSFRPTIILVM